MEDEVTIFIRQRKALGESEPAIANELLNVGWPPEIVRSAMDRVIATDPERLKAKSVRKIALLLLAAVVGIGILAAAIIFILGLSNDNSRGQSPASQTAPAAVTPEGSNQSNANPSAQSDEEQPVLTTTAFERDEIRQGDIDTFLEVAITYAGQNRGRYPEASDEGWEVLTALFDEGSESLLDPRTGEPYEQTAATPGVGQIQYVERVVCDGDKLATGQLRNVAFKTRLESGDFYCVSAE